MSKTYKIYISLTLSPQEHFGVPRNKCKCGICPNGSIQKKIVEYYDYGTEYTAGEETFSMESLDDASNYFEAKYEDDDFNSYEIIEQSDDLSERNIMNPNDNDKDEFSDGIGNEQLDIEKVELYDDKTDQLLETTEQ